MSCEGDESAKEEDGEHKRGKSENEGKIEGRHNGKRKIENNIIKEKMGHK